QLGQERGLPIRLDEDPIACVVRGTGRILDHPEQYRNVLTTWGDGARSGSLRLTGRHPRFYRVRAALRRRHGAPGPAARSVRADPAPDGARAPPRVATANRTALGRAGALRRGRRATRLGGARRHVPRGAPQRELAVTR